MKGEKVAVAGGDDIGSTGEGAFEDAVVVWIAARLDRFVWSDHFGEQTELLDLPANCEGIAPELLDELALDFIEDVGREKDAELTMIGCDEESGWNAREEDG
jgi:hypothetical protein